MKSFSESYLKYSRSWELHLVLFQTVEYKCYLNYIRQNVRNLSFIVNTLCTPPSYVNSKHIRSFLFVLDENAYFLKFTNITYGVMFFFWLLLALIFILIWEHDSLSLAHVLILAMLTWYSVTCTIVRVISLIMPGS